jgi:hypothetical protein
VITFRYHIVSLVAVFLALAIGIVVGTTALNGPVTSDLRSQVNDLKKDRSQLAAQNKTLQGQVDQAGQFATTFGTQLTAGTLKNQSVLVIGMPGSSAGLQDAIANQLADAGATITGRLDFTEAFIDPAQASSIASLAVQIHGSVPGLQLPVTSDAGLLGAAVLGYVLTGQGGADQGGADEVATVLTAFSGLHMISSNPQGIESAKTIVLIGDGSLPSTGSAGQDELDLLTALNTDGGKVVVAGDAGSATKGIISLVRGSAAKSTISTVDDADSAVGQVSTTLAVAGAASGQVGQYGNQKGNDALFPTPTK